jgi:hypothetical protein
MATTKDGGLVARAVREALGTLVSPQMYGQIVARALENVGLTEIPEAGPEMASWIGGELQREIAQAVGSDAAELVAAQLAPIVAHASTAPSQSGARAFGSDKPTGVAVAQLTARARREQMKSTARVRLTPEQQRALSNPEQAKHTARPSANLPKVGAGPEGAAPRRVLAATADASLVTSLGAQLGQTAVVLQVLDLVALLDALDEPGGHDPIVLLDCQRPAIHVSSVAAISEDLPQGTTIVLLGASEEVWRELERTRGAACRWVRCSHEATTDDLRSLCAVLIG